MGVRRSTGPRGEQERLGSYPGIPVPGRKAVSPWSTLWGEVVPL